MGLALLAGAVGADVAHVTPPGLEIPAVGAALVALLGLAGWPLLRPINEVNSLAAKSASEIEGLVLVREPIQSRLEEGPLKLWGEDALLDWPGALGPILEERDRFMAQCIRDLATGAAARSPAYIRLQDGSYRYAVSSQGPQGANPARGGEGTYELRQGCQRIVAVVGTAHVRGMCRAWDSGDQDLDSLV